MGQVAAMSVVETKQETVLERAVRMELKRTALIASVGSSHRTAGTVSVSPEHPIDPAEKTVVR